MVFPPNPLLDATFSHRGDFFSMRGRKHLLCHFAGNNLGARLPILSCFPKTVWVSFFWTMVERDAVLPCCRVCFLKVFYLSMPGFAPVLGGGGHLSSRCPKSVRLEPRNGEQKHLQIYKSPICCIVSRRYFSGGV